MKTTMKNFMVMVMVIALVCGALIMTRPEMLDVFKTTVEEAAVEVEVKEETKKEVVKIILQMDDDRTFMNYLILYKESWKNADSLSNLVDTLNEDTNDTYLVDGTTGKILKIVDKKAIAVEIEKNTIV